MTSTQVLTLAVLVLAGAGCCPKYKCSAPPPKIAIRDAAGAAVPGASIAGLSAERCAAEAECEFVLGTRVGVIVVSAPGYKPATVTIEPREDDCGNAMGQRIQVTLMPEASADPSATAASTTDGCGS